MLRAILATFVLMTGVLSPQLAAPGDTADTSVPEAPDSAAGEDTGDPATTDTSGADTAPEADDTAGDPGFGAVDLSGEPGGCGCASSSASEGRLALVALGAVALVLRRRRA